MIRCYCSRPTTEPGRLCAGCERRRTPPVLPPLPERTGSFVPAPRVQAAPPRRLPALEPSPDLVSRPLAADVPCVTPGCERTAHVGHTGPTRRAEHEGKCGKCINALRAAAEKAARLRRHGVAA